MMHTESRTDDYIISGGEAGKSRLNVLSDALREYEESFLKRLGVAEGMSFFDAGTGGGNVAMLASKIAGDTGRVVAVDFDERILALAKEDAAKEGISNISFQATSIYDIHYRNEFDVVYARFLLSHLKRPEEALNRIVESARPGGIIIVEDVHFEGHFCYPPSEAFDNYVHYYAEAARHKGEDANIGPSLPFLFERVGIKNIGFDVIQPCFTQGPGKQMALLTLTNIKDAIVELGVAGLHTIDRMLGELEAFTNDPQTIMSLPRIFRVWGVK